MKKKLSKFISNNSSSLLLGLGIGSSVLSVFLCGEATIKAVKIKQQMDEEKDTIEVVKAVWPVYIPTALAMATSVVAICCSNKILTAKNAVITAACQLAETTYSEYREKVKEVVGEKKEGEIRHKVAEDKVEHTCYNNPTVYYTGAGDTEFFDEISGRYFKSDIEAIRKAVNDLNYQLMNDMYISLNEYYDAIGLDPVAVGEGLGWNIGRGMIEVRFGAMINQNTCKPVLVAELITPPYVEYDKVYG